MISIILPHSSVHAAEKRTIQDDFGNKRLRPHSAAIQAILRRLESGSTLRTDLLQGPHSRVLHCAAQLFPGLPDCLGRHQHVQFGPIQVQNRGSRIQFWPDFRNWQATLPRVGGRRPCDPDEETFSRTSVAVQGLPALERLLANGHQEFDGAADLFKCALTETIAHNLSRIASTLSADWNPQNGYAHIISMAGSQGSPYSEAREVPVELMQGLIAELKQATMCVSGDRWATQDKARPKLAEAPA